MALLQLSAAEAQRYQRHIALDEIGVQGQLRLKRAAVLLVGAGGLGSPAALYLAAAGVGIVGIVDADVVERSNLQRQIVHGESQVGRAKVDSASARLHDINPHVEVRSHRVRLTRANAAQLLQDYDVVLDGSDNFATRYALNDACVFLGKTCVYASVARFDGQLSVFDARRGPCYRCLYPTPPAPGLAPGCSELGVLGVLPGVLGVLQATEALKLLLDVGEPLIGRLLLLDALSMQFTEVGLDKDPQCVVCGPQAQLQHDATEESCGMSPSDTIDITPTELAERLKGGNTKLVDVREPHEWDHGHIAGAKHIPLGEVEQRKGELNPNDDIVLYCKMGGRSRHALELLRAAGFKNLKNLAGGITAWSREIDPSIPT